MAYRRCLLLTAAALVLAVPLARAQAGVPSAAAAPSFDVISIHQNNSATDGHHHIYNNPSESHFRTVNLSTKDLLQFAYGLPKSQILGGPPWLDSTMFDIDAKSDPSVDAQLHALPSDQARRQKMLMVQALLAERFQLAAHQETRELSVYALVVAKGGPKFKPSQINGTTINSSRSLRVSSPRSSAVLWSTTPAYPVDMISPSNGPPTMHRRCPTERPIPTHRLISSRQFRSSSASNSNPPKAPFPCS
jgi:hypothetical protein